MLLILRSMRRPALLCFGLLLFAVVVAAIDRHSIVPAAPREDGRFRLAIIGLTHAHAWGYLREAAKIETVELAGIAEANAELRELAAKEAPGVPVYEEYPRMLREKRPDAVWAFVENDRHLEIVRECAPRGIHLIFEKPMAATYAEAREMMALAGRHAIKLMINYQTAWWPENQAAYDLARSGALGRITRMRAIAGHGGRLPIAEGNTARKHFWSWLNDRRRGGGALLDFTCYGAVWLRWYLGLPKTVYAVTARTRPHLYQVETSATILATFPRGETGLIEGSWDLPRGFYDLEALGDKGSFNLGRNRLEIIIGRERRSAAELPADRREPISYFIDRVRSGREIEGIVSPALNLDAMQIMEAARLSAESGRPVNLPLDEK